jgi:hypothetical protein
MLYTDDSGPPVRIVNVPALPEYPDNAIGDGMAPGVATHDDGLTWYIFGDDGTGAPDWTDGATVGAIAEAVRVRLHRPFLETHVGADGNFYIADFAPENEPQESPDWPTMRTDGTFGNNLKPEVCGANRGLAWLAAYHAHRDAAGTTANDIEVLRG